MAGIDRDSGTPAYRQVADRLRASIRSGELLPGTKLRSERELSELYGTSRVTVRQAVAELRAEGIVVAQHGRGLFVRPRPPIHRLGIDRLHDNRRGPFLVDAAAQDFTPRVEVDVRVEAADAATASWLQVAEGTAILVRDRLMFADDQPVQIARSSLPHALVAGTAITETDTGPGGIYARLAELGHGPTEFTELVSSRMPRPEEAVALQLGEGTPVLLLTRIAYAVDGTPVEVNTMILAADRYELIYTFPAGPAC